MSPVTIEFTRRIAGFPEPGTVVTVERTDTVDAVLALGAAIELPDETAPAVDLGELGHASQDAAEGHQDLTDATNDLTTVVESQNPDEQTAPDGSTKLPTKKTARKRVSNRND